MNPTNPKMLREHITLLEHRLSVAKTKEILLLEKLIALEAKYKELERKSDGT